MRNLGRSGTRRIFRGRNRLVKPADPRRPGGVITPVEKGDRHLCENVETPKRQKVKIVPRLVACG